jgi:hypothetical protein
MTISEGDALITLLLATAPSTKRMGKSIPLGGIEETLVASCEAVKKINVPFPSVHALVSAAHPNVPPP